MFRAQERFLDSQDRLIHGPGARALAHFTRTAPSDPSNPAPSDPTPTRVTETPMVARGRSHYRLESLEREEVGFVRPLENARLRAENERLQAENDRLRTENEALQAIVDNLESQLRDMQDKCDLPKKKPCLR